MKGFDSVNLSYEDIKRELRHDYRDYPFAKIGQVYYLYIGEDEDGNMILEDFYTASEMRDFVDLITAD